MIVPDMMEPAMPPRRALLIAMPFVLPAARAAAEQTRHCGDPGGRFISCEAVRRDLPPPAWDRCPLCGRRHAAPP
ncbi:hypothetical protein GXW74_00710 [Roseomonas eburnea]|uniref:Uncharacterized protein n=1 Tax=Neoroseomonas eburnea TaxID=1346889 RepID=A0A9X9X5K8_9PROT|nr:hypothetical protein [Neoroseomonas eburnea]MBR0678994.1 hypothetical protein [Neoroseomonas eburnea]